MLPELTKSWVDLVALHVDIALRRSRSEPIDESHDRAAAQALDAMSRRTRTVAALVASLAPLLELSTEEELVAWILVASQLDPSVATRLEVLAGGPEITKGSLAAVAYGTHPARAIRELAPTGRLLRYGLVEHVDQSATSWARRTVRATERLLSLALLDADPSPPGCRFVRASRDVTKAELVIAEATAVALDRAVRSDAIVTVTGLPGSGKRTALTAFARDAGMNVLEIDARALSDDVHAFASELRTIARECKLLRRVPLFGNLDAIDAKPQHLAMLASELDGAVFATASERVPKIAWNRPM